MINNPLARHAEKLAEIRRMIAYIQQELLPRESDEVKQIEYKKVLTKYHQEAYEIEQMLSHHSDKREVA